MPVAGGHIKEGWILRSGALCFLKPEDEPEIRRLGLRTVVDLRTDDERARDGPDRFVQGSRVEHMPMRSYHGLGAESYRSLLLQNPRAWRDLFATLTRAEAYPLLFHCSAGKDRTGIVTALLLDGLGTPRAEIYADYLQSVANSPKLKVEREWLDEVFNLVDAVGGSRRFLEIQGVKAGDFEKIRKIIVDPVD
jgi:protein-tyrosine phosphatase